MNVLLLRSPSTDDPDKYHEALSKAGYNPISVSVLETALANLEQLESILTRNTSQACEGVIITSARACEAWISAVRDLLSESRSAQSDAPASVAEEIIDWSRIPFYVVGVATEKSLRLVKEKHGDTPYTPRDIRGAEESGTSERLAHFIVKDLKRTEGITPRLLYLTGDKNRDTLPSILKDSAIELESLKVYETQGSSQFAEDLEKVVSQTLGSSWWVVYFAPSAAEFVTPILERHFSLTPSISHVHLPIAKVAAIGPTTETFLRDSLHLHVAATPVKPTAECLTGAIVKYDSLGPITEL